MLPRPLVALALLLGVAPAQRVDAPDYRVYLWRADGVRISPEAAEALLGAGVTGVDAEGPRGVGQVVGGPLPFYVDHALPKGFLHVRPEEFHARRRDYQSRPSNEGLRRPPCLRDPAARAGALEDLRATLRALDGAAPDFLSLGDECGTTRGASPLDWCFCDECLAGLPRFLAARWGGEKAARAAWGDRWPAAGVPAPPTTEEARRAAFATVYDRATVVAWNDFRAYADAGFTDAVGWLAEEARAARPGLPVGILGCSMPSAFGGYDWERLARRLDVAEVYDHGAARALAGALATPATRFVHTLTPESQDPFALRARLWRKFLRGDLATILFWSRDWCVGGDPARPSPLLAAIGSVLKEFASPALAPWRAASPEEPRVALWFGVDSVRANWLAETRGDGSSWFNRLSSYEEQHALDARAREAWLAVCEDLGLPATFVDAARFRDDAALRRAIEALVLPRASALGDADVERISEFALRRPVIADARLALFTDRLEPRPAGALDRRFGLERPTAGFAGFVVRRDAASRPTDDPPLAEPGLRATAAFAERRTPEGDARLSRRTADARTLYLNAEVGDYLDDRLRAPERAERLRRALRPHVAGAAARARVRLEPLPGEPPWPVAVHVRRLGGDAGDLVVAVEINATTGDRAIDWEPLRQRPAVRVQLRFPSLARVEDLRTGSDLGEATELTVSVEVDSPRLFRLRRP